jgi:glycosyltransferase involved in cell wall biosynthesis
MRLAEDAPLRVAFTHLPRRRWAGGYNYQSNLFVALARYCPGAISPVLFAGPQDAPDEVAELAAIPGVEVVHSPSFGRRRTGLLRAVAFGLDRAVAAEFRAAQIDAVFESARFFGWRLPFPVVAWLPDFQHRRLPHLFSRAVRWRRDLGFRAQIASNRSILLSSNSALLDLRALYPGLTNNTCVLQFASEPSGNLLAVDPLEVIKEHGVPPRFFFLPNHLWRHKNHQLVLEALSILKRRGLDVVVVASGGVEDPREPGRFTRFMEDIRTKSLTANFLHLGMIPLAHVYALLRMTIALINPSTFEGWSTTVEEAKSFGVPVILSDIDVHLEQTGCTGRYFPVNDAACLADHLEAVWNEGGPVVVRDLLPNVEPRVRGFAEGFVNLVRSAHRRDCERRVPRVSPSDPWGHSL